MSVLYISSLLSIIIYLCCFFFFNDTATPEIYTLSLHDALPIWYRARDGRPTYQWARRPRPNPAARAGPARTADRKSTRLNSSHMSISYAVFCLKKKKKRKKKPELFVIEYKI